MIHKLRFINNRSLPHESNQLLAAETRYWFQHLLKEESIFQIFLMFIKNDK